MSKTSRQKEKQEWEEYYHRISQYERWSEVSREMSCFLRMLNKHLRETESSERELYLEVKKASELVEEAVKRGTTRYCETKPTKPYPRPYGYF